MKWGLDYKAAAKYEQVILDEHPQGWGAGGFVWVDGWPSSISTFDKLLATGRCPWLRLELAWADDHRFTDKYLKIVEDNAKLSRPLLEKYPQVEFFISPVTEHTLDRAAWNRFAAVADNVLRGTRYQLVNSPMRGGFVHDRLINEYHGADVRPRGGRYSFSHDGVNAVDTDMEGFKKSFAKAEYFMIWNSQMNGNRVLQEVDAKGRPFRVPRDKRKFYLTGPEQIDSFIYLSTDRGDVRIPAGWTLKSHGDQHYMPPRGKDQKPVIITPVREKYSEIVFRTRNGQVVARAPYFGTFNDKKTGRVIGHRYYCTEWGYQIAEKARRIHGVPIVQIWVNGKRVGRCNLAFRGGTFR
jgi:hypothetical protein